MSPNLPADDEPEEEFTSEELENSFPLAEDRRFAHQAGKDLVETVLAGMGSRNQRLRQRKVRDQERARVTVDALLANLVAGHLNATDPDRFVAVSFSRDTYNGSDLSLTVMQECRDYLVAENMIEMGPGFSRHNVFGDGRYGRRTRLRAAPRLRRMINEAELGKRPLTIPSLKLIRMRDKAKDVGPAPAHIEASLPVIEAINQRLAACDIAVRPEVLAALITTAAVHDGEEAETRARNRTYAGDFTATSIYRAFKGDWNSGGRFYGGWWMSLPKALRPYMIINGEPVVELDYKTLHPLLLYRRADLELDFDPYLVPPWLGNEMRDLGKRTFNRLLNRYEPDPAKRLRIRAARGDGKVLPGRMKFSEYCSLLVRRLEGIHHWLGTKEGTRLQYEDSELALAVMQVMEKLGVPVLPIHDSFIVPAHHEEALRLSMVDAFASIYGDIPSLGRTGPSVL